MDWRFEPTLSELPDELAQGLLVDDGAVAQALDWCGSVRGCRAIVLGAGGAGLADLLLAAGAAGVASIDLQPADSAVCVAGARPGRRAADAAGRAAHSLAALGAGAYDLAIGCCAFAESTSSGVADVLATLRRVLVPAAPVVLVEPHPYAALVHGRRAGPFALDCGALGWFGSRNRTVVGRLSSAGGGAVPVRYVQKSFEDWFVAVRDAGYSDLPELAEFGVDDEVAASWPEHFGPSLDGPLHLGLRLRTPASWPAVRRL